MRAYTGNLTAAATTVIETNPVASAICDLMRERGGQVWEGTPTALYDELTELVGTGVANTRGWPRSAQALSRRLNSIKSALRPAGIKIEQQKGGRRLMRISAAPEDGD